MNICALLLTFAVLASTPSNSFARLVAGKEKVIVRSPSPKDIFTFTPAIAEGFDGRLVAVVDFGGPGTAKLDGPRSSAGDYESGNQIRVLLSDNGGRSWRETPARIPMMHEIIFKAGKSLYMIGHSDRLEIIRSDDNGETWSDPAMLREGHWHQSCCAVDISDGCVTLVYEKQDWVHSWPGVAPVLMKASLDSDLTRPESWRFSEPFDPDRVVGEEIGQAGCGILESNVVRVHNPSSPFYDPSGRSVAILMRANAAYGDMGAVLKGVDREDGTLAIEQYPGPFGDRFFLPIPGGNLKFHILYDAESGLYWLLHSQIDGRMHPRRRLAISFSPDLVNWTFAGLVAVGPSDNAGRQYATMCVHGRDLLIVSRSGDLSSSNAHDANIITFHKVRNFRRLVY